MRIADVMEDPNFPREELDEDLGDGAGKPPSHRKVRHWFRLGLAAAWDGDLRRLGMEI